MYCTGIAVSQFNILQKLHLEHCSLGPSHMRVLQQGFCKCNNEKLEVAFNYNFICNNCGLQFIVSTGTRTVDAIFTPIDNLNQLNQFELDLRKICKLLRARHGGVSREERTENNMALLSYCHIRANYRIVHHNRDHEDGAILSLRKLGRCFCYIDKSFIFFRFYRSL